MSKPDTKIEFADSLRGLACLFVVIIHYWGPFWINPQLISHIVNTNPPARVSEPPYLHSAINALHPFDFGAFGVALFFLVSGLVIPLSLERFRPSAFLVARACRIVPTYALCFCVTVTVIIAGGIAYDRPYPFTLLQTLLHVVPGALYLSGLHKIDPILWTLEVEVAFYLVCAAWAGRLRQNPTSILCIPYLLLGALLASRYLGAPWMRLFDVVPYLIFMFAGVVIHLHWRGHISGSMAMATALGLLLAADCAIQIMLTLPILPILRASYGAAFLAFCVLYLLRERIRTPLPLRALALISYPLYAVHEVFGFAFLRILSDLNVQADLACLVTFAIAAAISTLVHYAVERPTQTLGRRWGQGLEQGMSLVRALRCARAPALQPSRELQRLPA